MFTFFFLGVKTLIIVERRLIELAAERLDGMERSQPQPKRQPDLVDHKADQIGRN
jgi:hypothetical protein